MDTTSKPNTKTYVAICVEKVCTERHKKSEQTTAEASEWMIPEQASNVLFLWKRDYDDESTVFHLDNNFLMTFKVV
jgi:hypothetical protein